MLSWVNRFSVFCFLDNQHYQRGEHRYEFLLAAGVLKVYDTGSLNDLDNLLQNKQWCFGHLSYDLKNSIHGFNIDKENRQGFPLFNFFVPLHVFELKEDKLTIHTEDPDKLYAEIEAEEVYPDEISYNIHFQQRISKEEYIAKIKSLQKHILAGDCYEINFCLEFFSENTLINPLAVFQKLSAVSPNPFSCFYRCGDSYLICASPERFLLKQGNIILSQPMKGTIKRDLENIDRDKVLFEELKSSAKDKSENVMVVDMVRNDLTKICTESSVNVDELFGVYTYPHVHQMISTISGELKPGISFTEIIKATFPMGSMTGAPKHRVMELIDEYEPAARGIFSGSVGYINPEGDFDLNVVIRSIMYNASTQYLSYGVGSGITFYSDPQKEWEECLLKGEAIKKVLSREL